jgi:hypothetical protein
VYLERWGQIAAEYCSSSVLSPFTKRQAEEPKGEDNYRSPIHRLITLIQWNQFDISVHICDYTQATKRIIDGHFKIASLQVPDPQNQLQCPPLKNN